MFELGSFICDGSISISELTFIVLEEKFESSGAITTTLGTWMSCNPNNSDSIELTETIILELLRHCPWNEVSRGSNATLELLSYSLLTNFALKADLNSAKNVW